MKVVLVSSEVSPLSRTGMLGDTVAGLAKGLSLNGVETCVISPMYLTICTDEERYNKECSISVTADHKEYSFDVYTAEIDGLHFILLRNDDLYGRRNIYGPGEFDYSDNDIRFGIFSLATLEYISKCTGKPDIIHCHEWPTGLAPVYRNLYYHHIQSKIVFTAHDLSFQGIFDKFSIQKLGLPWDIYNIEELEYYDGISFLKGGLVHADYITVPSPSYCKDIQTEEHSQGLGLLMSDLSSKLEGILGGIDFDIFNPETDRCLAENYTSETLEKRLINKVEFLKQAGLSDISRPLFMVDTKIRERKGLDLIIDSAEALAGLEANFAFFGYGESYLCSKFKEITNKYDNIYTFIGNSETMVHLAYGAADFILRPSLYEPSGKSHLKGMRYGALPVVSRTGGHLDTVKDMTEDNGYGLFIKDYSRQELQNKIEHAVDFYKDKTILTECMKRAMHMDYSWKSASLKYIGLYERLLGGNE